jgi:hypothetical protein
MPSFTTDAVRYWDIHARTAVGLMASELQPIDVTDRPELRRLAEEVHSSQQPRLLRSDSEDLAVLTPVRKASPRARAAARGRRISADDSLFAIIGIAPSVEGEPTDVSANKHKYLADAYSSHAK